MAKKVQVGFDERSPQKEAILFRLRERATEGAKHGHG